MFKYLLILLIGALWGCADCNLLLHLERRCMTAMSYAERKNHLRDIKTCTADIKERIIMPENRYLLICEENSNLCMDKLGSYYKNCLYKQEESVYDFLASSFKKAKALLCGKSKDAVIERFRKQDDLDCVKNDKALLQRNIMQCLNNLYTENVLVLTKSSICEAVEELKTCINDKFWTLCKSEEQLENFDEVYRPFLDGCNDL